MDIHEKIKDLESLPDEALIERYNRNITEAADILYGRHHQTIRLIVSQKIPVKEDCEDLVQEIFCRILSKLKEQYAESGRFSGWIRTITYHFISEYYRKQKRLPVMTTEIPDNLERDIPPDESLLRSLESVYAEMSKRINELQPKEHKAEPGTAGAGDTRTAGNPEIIQTPPPHAAADRYGRPRLRPQSAMARLARTAQSGRLQRPAAGLI